MDPQTVVIALAVLAYVIYRQFSGRFVEPGAGLLLPGILTLYGLVQIIRSPAEWGALAVGFVVVELALSVGLGIVRAQAVRLSLVDGYLYRRGSWQTLLWWVVSIGARLGVALLAGHTAAGPAITTTLMLSFGVSLAAQNLALAARVRADGRPLCPSSRGAGRRARRDQRARATLGR